MQRPRAAWPEVDEPAIRLAMPPPRWTILHMHWVSFTKRLQNAWCVWVPL